MSKEQIQLLLNSCVGAINQRLTDIFDEQHQQYGQYSRIDEAMRYSCLNTGKRIRPFLLIQSARLFNIGLNQSLHAAAAIELIHNYSLIHDDLPAMDNDDMRRGKPTLHKKYDDATAILAGDAMLTLAFETLSDKRTSDDANIRCALIAQLAHAAGAYGMVGGQMLDLSLDSISTDDHLITHMQRLKTGCLFEFSCQAGAILGNASHQEKQALQGYSQQIGLLFQMTDDLLDHIGDTKIVGKKTNKDSKLKKATFVDKMGVKQAQQHCALIAEQACAHLKIFNKKGNVLKDLAHFIIKRVA